MELPLKTTSLKKNGFEFKEISLIQKKIKEELGYWLETVSAKQFL